MVISRFRSRLLNNTDLSILFVFSGTRGAMYPLSRYPMIAAFRAMLFGICDDREMQHRDGELFLCLYQPEW